MNKRILVGHRGCKGAVVENTLSAFQEAVKRKYHYIETDVRVSKDGVFVLFHDTDFYRLVLINDNIESMQYEDFREYPLHMQQNEAVYTDKIMKLDTFLEFCKENKIHPLLDLKWTNGINNLNQDNVIRLVRMLQAYDLVKEVIIISSMRNVLLAIQEIEPQTQLQYLVGINAGFNEETIAFCINNHISIDLDVRFINKETIDLFHRHNLSVNTWVINNKKQAEELFEMGVDMITTDSL